jgi:hypothetical protein
VLPIFPIILCVFIPVFSVASLFSLWNIPVFVPLLLSVSCSCFLVLPGFDSSACPDPEPTYRSIPCPTSLDYWPLPAFDQSFACPCIWNKLLLLRLWVIPQMW